MLDTRQMAKRLPTMIRSRIVNLIIIRIPTYKNITAGINHATIRDISRFDDLLIPIIPKHSLILGRPVIFVKKSIDFVIFEDTSELIQTLDKLILLNFAVIIQIEVT